MNVFLYFVGMALIICWALGAFNTKATNAGITHAEKKTSIIYTVNSLNLLQRIFFVCL